MRSNEIAWREIFGSLDGRPEKYSHAFKVMERVDSDGRVFWREVRKTPIKKTASLEYQAMMAGMEAIRSSRQQPKARHSVGRSHRYNTITNSQISTNGRTRFHFVTQAGRKPSSDRVQCSIRVQDLVKQGEWQTFLALKFVHTDRFQKRRVVYLAMDKPEPDAADEEAQWPDESFVTKQRTTEIQLLSAQPVGEQEPIAPTLKVTERSDTTGRFFWREVLGDEVVLELPEYPTMMPPSSWRRIMKEENEESQVSRLEDWYGKQKGMKIPWMDVVAHYIPHYVPMEKEKFDKRRNQICLTHGGDNFGNPSVS